MNDHDGVLSCEKHIHFMMIIISSTNWKRIDSWLWRLVTRAHSTASLASTISLFGQYKMENVPNHLSKSDCPSAQYPTNTIIRIVVSYFLLLVLHLFPRFFVCSPSYMKSKPLSHTNCHWVFIAVICFGFIDTVPFENPSYGIYTYRKELWVHLYTQTQTYTLHIHLTHNSPTRTQAHWYNGTQTHSHHMDGTLIR